MADNDTVPTLTSFTQGDLVISISGDGDGSGAYTDNQGSPITLEELTPDGTIVGQMVLPQTTTVVNGTTEYAISGEYGSSSEGTLELSADGQSLVIAGYGINAATYNAGGATVYGNAALAQTTSITGGTYTAVARVIADIGFNGTVDTSTALYNIANTNNPRSVATVNGTSFYITGQGVKGDTTQGVFYAQDGASTPTAIDTSTDTRTAEIYNGELYVSRDSTQGTGGTSNIASYGTTLPTGATTPTTLVGIGGTVTLTAAQENTVNSSDVGTTVHLSPENFFFASPNVLYVADGGDPKEGGLGDGGLQKWVLTNGTWTLAYTLSQGLDLVPDTATSGTTGLIGLTGTVVGGTVELYATNSTLGDLDQTYLYGITDTLASTTGAGESFTTLVTAAPDTNIRGIAFAPSATTPTPTTTVIASGVTSAGLTVTSGSTLTVNAGGAIVDATILSGGIATIASSGTDSGTIIGQGGMETVLGSATGDQVEGTQVVSATGAFVGGETIFNGGVIDLFLKGETASGVTVDSGGTLNISGNATGTDLVISGGTIDLQSPKAVLTGALTFEGPGTLEVGVILSAGAGLNIEAVISGFGTGDAIGEAAIVPGATLTSATVNGNTVATISGSNASGTAVSEQLTFAGTIANLQLTNDATGGVEITTSAAPPSVITVSSTETSSGLVVTSGSTVNVLAGGHLVDASVQAGGLVTIQTSGTDSGTTLLAGSNETVLGSATGDQVFGTQLVSAATAVVSGETVQSGGTVDLFLKGASAVGLTVLSGGTINANGNVSVTNTVMSGGVFDLQSPKATLLGGFTFAGPATLEATDITSAAFQNSAVISGFGAGDAVDETVIPVGATMTTTTVSGNTEATITSSDGSIVESFTFAGIVTNLQLVNDTTGGVEIVASGSTAPTAVTVSNTVTSSGLVVTSGSTVDVLAGGHLVNASVQAGGLVTIETSGTDSGTTLAAGANETVLGNATGDQVFGTQLVSAATAVVSGETVQSGGTVDLFLKGVSAVGLTVLAGGTVNANGNVSATNTVMSGGVFDLASPKATLEGGFTFVGPATLEATAITSAAFQGSAVISGFGAGDVIDETLISSGATFTTATVSGNTVATITSGAVSESFTFAGAVTDLQLISDGATGVEITTAQVVPTAITVSSSVTSTGLSVTSGSTVNVLAGGHLVDASVQAGGLVTIQTSGTDSGTTLLAGGNETVLGSATADQVFGTQLVSAATAVVSGETVQSGGIVDLFLKGVSAVGLVVEAGGTVNANGNVSATNTVMSGGVFDLQSPKATLEGGFTFAGPATLEVTDLTSAAFQGSAVISGFAPGDLIDVTVIGNGATLTSTLSGGNTVETITSGTSSEAFTFAGTYGTGYFNLVSDGGTGVEITATGTPCYCRGTLIQTAQGEKPVEDLQIGDQLVVRSGAQRAIRWIGLRSYAGQFAAGNRDVLPVVIRAGALADGVPRRDLSVSPLHAMFLDEVLVPAGALVNGTTIVQAQAIDRVEYFHLELATHDVILAEGALSESFVDDDSRGMFHNASEYRALYPALTPVPAQYCAPRVEDGPLLAAIQQRLNARAGSAAAPVAPGALAGQLDRVTRQSIAGWARDAATPDQPVRLLVIDNGLVLGEILADQYRSDLQEAGIGSGCHAYELLIPGGLSPTIRHVIEVVRVGDGAVLANAPWVLDAMAPPAIVSAPAFTGRGQVDDATRDRIAGWAQDPADPANPVALQILDNGTPIARVLANGYRPDLAAAGVGAGRHAFDVIIPGGLSPLSRHVITVRQERDGAELAGSPVVIEAIGSFGSELEQAVAQAVAAIGSAEERKRVLSFIAAQADRLLQQQADAQSGRTARTHGKTVQRRGGPVALSKPRALVIDAFMPDATRDAGSQAILSHLRALQALGYGVSFVAADEMAADGAGLEAADVTVCGTPFYASVEEVLRRQAGGFDLVYLHRAPVASHYLTLARSLAPRARVIYSVADLHHLRLERQAAIEERPELLALSRRVRLEEYRAAWAADAVITHSAAEADMLRQAVPEANIHVVGWHYPARAASVPFADRQGIAFIGNYAHAPNVDAARWLAETIMPLVWQASPTISLTLVGHAMPALVSDLTGPQIITAGHVADLPTVLDRVRLTVAPLRFGAGLKGKVLESFAAGVPCVMSPIAAEGLALDGLLVGSDAAALAALIVRVHDDAALHQAAVQAGAARLPGYTADAVEAGLRAAIAGEIQQGRALA